MRCGGVAVLGILTMNAVSYGLDMPAYFNLDAGGSSTWLDWAIGGMGEILFDQKFMGLFSLLFGAGIVMFADRAAAKQRRPVGLSLWRNTLLLGIGIAHMALWEGDILVLYAICSPLLIWLRRLRPATLTVIGAALVVSAAVVSVLVQASIDDPATELGGLWLEGEKSDGLGLWFVYDFGARALGMMLLGVALYRTGVVTGERPRRYYMRTAWWGLAVGLPLSSAGFAVVAASGFSGDWALAGAAPNTLATIPLTLAYLSLITLWNSRAESRLRGAGAGRGPHGAHQLPRPNRHRHHRAARAVRQRRPHPQLARTVHPGGVGGAALVVAGLAQPLPLRPRRVALALRHLPPLAAPAGLDSLTRPHPHPARSGETGPRRMASWILRRLWTTSGRTPMRCWPPCGGTERRRCRRSPWLWWTTRW